MIVIILLTESTKSILLLNVMSQSDFAVKVKGQTKIGRKIDKRTAMIEKHTTLYLTPEENKKWRKNGFIDKSRRHKYIQNVHI